MAKITAYNIVKAIGNLPRNRDFNYVNDRTPGKIRIVDITMPAGPITIRRWNPNKGGSYQTAKDESISSEMIWRIANALSENEPLNVDRLFAGSYNTRSVLEALIASTPEFYYCYPGRIMDKDGRTSIEHGHKHLIWTPNEPHENGVICKKDVENMAISEIPAKTIVYNDIVIPETLLTGGPLDIEVARRHTQIQIALYIIGMQLGYRTWIAQNDMGIQYKGKPLVTQPNIISSLSSDDNLLSRNHAESEAKLIDCIWFQNGRFMPAVMEVEHTTGVTSGLTRMKGLYDMIPDFKTRYVIVAPDEDRDLVIEKANRQQFHCLDTRYFSYSSVEELYHICTHRNLHGVTQEFLDCYMEKVLYT